MGWGGFASPLQHVGRHLDRRRPRPCGPHLTDGLEDYGRHLFGPAGAARPLGDRAQHVQLVRDLVEHPEAGVDVLGVHLAGDAQDR